MLKIILQSYLLDLGMNILFDGIYKNIISANMTHTIEGSNMIIDSDFFSLILYDIYGNMDSCVQLGKDIMNDIMYMEPKSVVTYIYTKYGIESELIYNDIY